MSNKLILLVALFGIASLTQAAKPALEELQANCEAARAAKLAPERDALIQTCIKEKDKTAEQCEQFYADYGAGGRMAGGAGRARLYNDLPECKALYQAEKDSSKR